MDNDKLIPINAMAARARVTRRWLKEQAEAGLLPSVKAGTTYLFHAPTVETILLNRAKQHPVNKETIMQGNLIAFEQVAILESYRNEKKIRFLRGMSRNHFKGFPLPNGEYMADLLTVENHIRLGLPDWDIPPISGNRFASSEERWRATNFEAEIRQAIDEFAPRDKPANTKLDTVRVMPTQEHIAKILASPPPRGMMPTTGSRITLYRWYYCIVRLRQAVERAVKPHGLDYFYRPENYKIILADAVTSFKAGGIEIRRIYPGENQFSGTVAVAFKLFNSDILAQDEAKIVELAF